MILGTAGHIDHGKTALVRALTGVDTDRLPEEKRRGITIALGFAPLVLEDVGTLGIVDVPGHEAFVRTMLAGATGIDLALLVVAADEGVMPQTREHVAILDLLGIRGGVIALTKSDLVDEEWLDLVREDVRTLVRGTPLASAAIVATSAITGAGLAELRLALGSCAAAIPARDASDVFRMPVDRVFSARGTGTVVTGTIWSGTVVADATLWLHPPGRQVRVRGVQSHGAALSTAGPGTRAAIALAGVDVADVGRGSVLVDQQHWQPSVIIRADVALLDDAERGLRPREVVRLHLGTADVGARIIAVGGPLQPGDAAPVRVALDAPLLARAGDRFVLRRASPVATIGGGRITDPLPPHRRAKPLAVDLNDHVSRLLLLLREAGAGGIARALLPIRLGITPIEVERVLFELSKATLSGGGRVYLHDVRQDLAAELLARVDQYHGSRPLEDGVAVAALRGSVRGDGWLIEESLRGLVESRVVELGGGIARRAGWRPALSESQEALKGAMLDALSSSGREPPSVSELEQRFGNLVVPLLRILEKEGFVVQVETDRYFGRGALDELVLALRQGMADGHTYSPADLREMLVISRKYLIPFLEYCDREGVTERRQAGRVLHYR